MVALLPDNQNRANRVNQLASDIAQLQTQIKETVEDAKLQGSGAVSILDKIAKSRGYGTLEEYIAWAESQLSAEDKERYQSVKKELDNQDEALDLGVKVAIGIAGIGFVTGLSATTIGLIFQRGLITVTLQAAAVGLVRIITGNVSEGVGLMQAAGRILNSVLKGEALADKVATVLKVLKVAGEVLSALGIAFDAIALIYEAIGGAKQGDDFVQAIKDLCVRRFTTKKIQRYALITLQNDSDAAAIADYYVTVQELVDAGDMPQQRANEKVQAKLNDLAPKITGAIDAIDDQSVWNALDEQDKSSNIAWRNEDPSLEEMLAIIDSKLDKSE
ncbi:hypothetical protein AX16_002615 [Volvariella volvacea WC 439]|nr:hypothetical protein AX16_002615 [Volvariella volvacea WC 439]